MSRRPSRRIGDDGSVPFVASSQSKTRSSPWLSIGLVVVGAVLIIGYIYTSVSGGSSGNNHVIDVNNLESGVSCTLEIESALPSLKKVYGNKMHKVLHVGPSTCSVVSKLLEEEEAEAWGIDPYELEEVDSNCKGLISKGIVRVVDIKYPLPYQSKSFSLVLVSDALDYLSPKYLNKTLPELARVSKDGIVVFNGFPGIQKAKVPELSKFGRPAKMRSSSWWIRYFLQTGLKEDEVASKKFEQAAKKNSYKPACQIFHLRSHH